MKKICTGAQSWAVSSIDLMAYDNIRLGIYWTVGAARTDHDTYGYKIINWCHSYIRPDNYLLLRVLHDIFWQSFFFQWYSIEHQAGIPLPKCKVRNRPFQSCSVISYNFWNNFNYYIGINWISIEGEWMWCKKIGKECEIFTIHISSQLTDCSTWHWTTIGPGVFRLLSLIRPNTSVDAFVWRHGHSGLNVGLK